MAKIVAGSDADVVALQEDVQPRPVGLPAAYRQVATCRAEVLRHTNQHLHNTWLVRRAFPGDVQPRVPPALVLAAAGCRTARCAASVVLAGSGGRTLTLTNVHLCGGRIDDPAYQTLQRVKARELRLVLDNVKPDVVVGDFNGERAIERARRQLEGHPLYRRLRTDEQRQVFLEFYRSCHDLLDRRGYVPVYDEALVRRTNSFGGVSDWVYVRHRLLHFVRNVRVIDTGRHSDHQGILVEFDLG